MDESGSEGGEGGMQRAGGAGQRRMLGSMSPGHSWPAERKAVE